MPEPETPSPDEVLAQLAAILGDPQFARSKRSSSLLQFLVSQALKNDTERIKEYLIATEVFDREESFDPRIDSLVRVEANRLRARLKSYYEGPGNGDRVRIDVPVGSYVPVFELVSAPEPAAPTAAAIAPASPGGRLWRTAGIAIGVLATLWIVWSGAGFLRETNRRLVRPVRVSDGGSLSAFPAVSAVGNWMVFSSDKGGGSLKLWKKTGNGEAVPITSGDCNDTDPDVSDDGKWIAYHSDCNGGGVFLMPSTGGAARLAGRFGHSPRFNPGATQLAYWVRNPRTGFGSIFRARLDVAEEPHHIAREFDDAHNPAWTPDGRGIFFCGTRRSGGGAAEEHDFWIDRLDGRPALKTGAFERFGKSGTNPHTDILPATSFHWIGERELLFAAQPAGNNEFHRVVFDSEWRIVSDSPVTTAAIDQPIHPYIAGAKIAFATARSSAGIWSLDLAANDGRVTGVPQRLTGSREAVSPAISADGKILVFSSPQGRRQFALSKLDLATGKMTEVATFPGSSNRLKLSPDGRTVYLRLLEGTGVRKQPIYGIDINSGVSKKICADCGPPTHVTPDGKLILYEAPNTVVRLSAVRVDTGERWEFLEHPHHAVTSGRVSPDGKWIAFQSDRGLDGRQVHVAPFKNGARIDVNSWISITEPEQMSWDPWWSPDGSHLYFVSQRDGNRCVWAQRVDGASKRPAGAPVAIQHFHAPGLNPLSFSGLAPLYIGLSVVQDRLLLSLSETRSEVWTGEIERIR